MINPTSTDHKTRRREILVSNNEGMSEKDCSLCIDKHAHVKDCANTSHADRTGRKGSVWTYRT
jgi:hypothetical protein